MPDKAQEARGLAEKHFEIEEGMGRIFRLLARPEAEQRPDEPITLLEINDFTIPSGIMPIEFAPAPASGIHFPPTILEVTPTEFDDIQADRLKLPEGWEIGEEFQRPASTRCE